MTTTLKQCKDCGKEKPATLAYFPFRKGHKDGLAPRCRECQAEKDRQSYWGKLPGKKPRQPKVVIKKIPETQLERAIETFLEARKNLSGHTIRGYRRVLRDYAKGFPDFPPTAQSVTDWLNQKKVAKGTKHSLYGRLCTFCKWLYKTKQVTDDPLKDIVRPGRVQVLPRAPKEANTKSLITFLESRVETILENDPRLRHSWDAYRSVRALAVFTLMLDTGLRVGEVCRLRLSDVDLEEMSIFVDQPKNSKQRYVMFGKKVKGNLRLWLQVRAGLGLDDELDFLFVGKRGKWDRLSESGVATVLKNLCLELGIKRISPHMLRHAHAGQAIKNGQNIEELRQQMGHTNITMTARYFMLPSEGRQKSHLRTSPLDNLGRAA